MASAPLKLMLLPSPYLLLCLMLFMCSCVRVGVGSCVWVGVACALCLAWGWLQSVRCMCAGSATGLVVFHAVNDSMRVQRHPKKGTAETRC